MAARKKTPARKATSRKAPTKKKKAAAGAAKAAPRKKKAAPRKKKAARAPEAAPPEPSAPAAAPNAGAAATGSVSSRDVNMGHVFALRPRPSTSFRQEHFLEARRLLEEEGYASIEEAARAVVEKALDLTQGRAEGRRDKHRRGY